MSVAARFSVGLLLWAPILVMYWAFFFDCFGGPYFAFYLELKKEFIPRCIKVNVNPNYT